MFKKRLKNYIIPFSLVFAMLFSTPVYADNEDNEGYNTNWGSGEEIYIRSDGEDGYQTEHNTDVSTNSQSSNVRQLTQAEMNTSAAIGNVRTSLNDIRNQIRNNPETSLYGNFFTNMGGSGTDIITFGSLPISRLEYADILNNFMNYRDSLNSTTNYFNNISLPSVTFPELDSNSFTGLSGDDQRIVTNGIVSYATGNNDLSRNTLMNGSFASILTHRNRLDFGLFRLGCAGTGMVGLGNLLRLSLGNLRYPNGGGQMNNYYLQTPDTQLVRTDIFSGEPYLRATENYTDRFTPLLQRAREEGWPIDTIINIGDPSGNPSRGMLTAPSQASYRFANNTDMRWNGVSSSLSDQYYIGLLTDYHIDSVQTDVITNINYTSNERRWTITRDGEPVSEPVITNNPYHELDFTPIYQEHGPGRYDVFCEQYATYVRSMYVMYSTGEYLFDLETGTILWFDETLTSSNNGSGINLGTVSEEGWVATGDTFTVNVNDLGTVEVGETGTDRVD